VCVLQTNVDSRLGSIRCPAVQNAIPLVSLALEHPLSVVSKIHIIVIVRRRLLVSLFKLTNHKYEYKCNYVNLTIETES